MTATPALQRWRQEGHEREAILGCLADPVFFLKSTKKVLKNMLYELSVNREVII